MDDRLKRRILEMSTRLAVEEKERLEAAGTLVDLERLTVEIGDELTRQLTGLLLTSRAQEAAQQQFHPCPECGRGCPIEELEPLLLPGRRGEMEYSEPQCHCPCCRRAFFPVARTLQRPPRENVTPLVLEKVVWAGANLGSYQQAVAAMTVLAEISLAPQQVQRMTSQIGSDCDQERQEQVAKHRRRTLMKRTTPAPGAEPRKLSVVMMDGGRFQRRDQFQERTASAAKQPEQPLAESMQQTASHEQRSPHPAEKTTHW